MSVSLTDLLDLEQLDTNLFRSRHHRENFRNTLFGGQVLAQALMAAHHTVPSRLPNSLHAYFLRAGSSASPVIYDVEIVRDGKSFSSRQVTARQNGHAIFKMLASFHITEEGFEHQADLENLPPPPEETASLSADNNVDSKIATHPKSKIRKPPNFDFVPVKNDLFTRKTIPDAQAKFWLRTIDSLPQSKIHHLCAIAFASDLGLLATAMLPHPTSLFHEDVWPASLDHAMWFHHNEFDARDWHFYLTDSPWAGAARGFARGFIYSQQGQLIASTVQEGLIRPVQP